MHSLHSSYTHAIINAALEVHNTLGFGYLEKIYRNALRHELMLRDIPAETEVLLDIKYKNSSMGHYFVDLIVIQDTVVEIKTVKRLIRKHFKQTEHYLKATGHNTGLLFNFSPSGLIWHRVFPKW